ncbi:MAG: endonuclease III [Bacilli bacterium]
MNKRIGDYLDELFNNPICELVFKKDYELLIAVVLSAQCTDKRVNQVTKVLFDKYKTLDDLNKADIEDIIKIIRPVGTFNKKSLFIKEIAFKLVNNYEGKVPNNRKALEELPGVGRKTTNVVLSVLFNEPTIAVDTHVFRVSNRLGLVKEGDSVNQVEQKLMKLIDKNLWSKRHHQLVMFGRYYCKARNPLCNTCKINDLCKYRIK